MANALILTAAALVPVAVLMSFFVIEDRFEREPNKNLARYFLFGVASLGLVRCCMVVVHRAWPTIGDGAHWLDAAFLTSLLVFGVIEESAKYACFRLAAWRDRDLNEPYDGCLYGATVGLGFAAVENIQYVLHPNALGDALAVAALRAATAVPAHALFGALWGLAFGLARCDRRYRGFVWLALSATMLLHGTYDWIADGATRLGQNVAGYAALLAIILFTGGICLCGIRAAHRRSPFRPQNEAD